MSEQQSPTGQPGHGAQGGQNGQTEEQQVVVVGPDGRPIGTMPAAAAMAMVSQGQAPSEGTTGDSDDERHLTELVEQPAKVMRIGGMIRQLLEEVKAAPLDEASRNRTEDVTPSEGELRIAQAQLVGWLEGLFHGLQTAIYAQQMAARAQFEQMRRGLPAGHGGHPGQPGQPGEEPGPTPGDSGGMYL